MEFLKLVFSVACTYPIFTCCLIGVMWVVVYVNKRNGDTQRFDVNTSQSRDELMARSGSALEKHTGEQVTSKRTRGGFQHETNSTFVSGQKVKERK